MSEGPWEMAVGPEQSSLVVHIQQSLSLSGTCLFLVLASFHAIGPVGTWHPLVFVSGTFSAAHTAVSVI